MRATSMENFRRNREDGKRPGSKSRLEKALEAATGVEKATKEARRTAAEVRMFLEEELRRTREKLAEVEKALAELSEARWKVEEFRWESCYVKTVSGRQYLYASAGGKEVYLGAVQPVWGKQAPEKLLEHLPEKPTLKRLKREAVKKLRNAEGELRKVREQLRELARVLEDALLTLKSAPEPADG